MTERFSVVTEGKSDEQFASEITVAARPHLDELAALMSKARTRGMSLNFAISYDPYGRAKTDVLNVTKVLA